MSPPPRNRRREAFESSGKLLSQLLLPAVLHDEAHDDELHAAVAGMLQPESRAAAGGLESEADGGIQLCENSFGELSRGLRLDAGSRERLLAGGLASEGIGEMAAGLERGDFTMRDTVPALLRCHAKREPVMQLGRDVVRHEPAPQQLAVRQGAPDLIGRVWN